MKQKPGVMIYFALWGSLQKLSDKELGAMFRAIMEFGMTGERPVLYGTGAILWPIIESQLMVDDQRYYERKLHGAYGAYVRDQNRKGEDHLSFQDWADRQMDGELLS